MSSKAKNTFDLTVFLIILLINQVIANNNDPIVKTKYGTYIGHQRNNEILAFEGIRYAKPPIGELRFEPPVMIDASSTAEYVVQKPGNKCMQWNLAKFEGDLLDGEEDCLFLNIYVPANKTDKKLPVVFHIHGGAWMLGQGDFYGPDYLLKQQDLILVNLNYRLGILGFLSSGDTQIPGNMGFKDQALALKWVHENIEAFGGDSNNIMITGWSAGAGSSHLHLLSPLSQNLFSKGISHSGCATGFWDITENIEERYNFIKSESGCNATDKASVVKCLKEFDAGNLIRLCTKLNKFWLFPVVEFAMVIEPPSDHAFMTETPLTVLQRGAYPKDKPWIFSLVEDEGAWFTASMIRNNDEKVLNAANDLWDNVAPYIFGYHILDSEEKKLSISKKIREHYFKNEKISNANVKLMTDALTDRYFRHGVSVLAKEQPNIHIYNFNFTVKPGLGSFLSNLEDASAVGVAHGDDLMLIYNTPYRKGVPLSEAETEMSNNLVEMYRSFAYKGEPSFGTLAINDGEHSSDAIGLTYIDIHNGNYGIKKIVPYEAFGSKGFWDSFEINDIL